MRKVFEIGGLVAGLVLIVFGDTLLLSGFGFSILAIGGALRNRDYSLSSIFGRRVPKTVGPTALPTA